MYLDYYTKTTGDMQNEKNFFLVCDNDFKIPIETHCVNNKDDLTKIKTEIISWVEYLRFEGYRTIRLHYYYLFTNTMSYCFLFI